MVVQHLKRLAGRFSPAVQQELRRFYFRRQIHRHAFMTDEAEYVRLNDWLRPGDWTLDIGANIGHYAMRMSDLVGAAGRVLAFEPVPDTFALLAANMQLCHHANVSLINAAVSDRTATVGMRIPMFSKGLKNYYQASLVQDAADVTVLTLSIDALEFPQPVRLVKIDVEGHELAVLRGMRRLIERDRPVLIVETSTDETVRLLERMNYGTQRLTGSSNIVCLAKSSSTT